LYEFICNDEASLLLNRRSKSNDQKINLINIHHDSSKKEIENVKQFRKQNNDNVLEELSKSYHDCNFDQVIDIFVNNYQTIMSRESLEFLSKSISKSV